MMNNIDIIKNMYRLFAEKDHEGIRNIFDENIEWNQMKGFPNGGQYKGADAILKMCLMTLVTIGQIGKLLLLNT